MMTISWLKAVKNKDAIISTLGYKNLWDKSFIYYKAVSIVLNSIINIWSKQSNL